MDILTSRTIKGYELREQVGAGGFGAVYHAYQSSVGREVAIKVILPQHANQPDFVRRFEVEAQLVARLEHPHIVPLYDYWRDPDGAYLVMRWLPNNLRQVIQRGPCSAEAATRLLEQLAAALTVAHREGIVHRDIKPDNILLDEDDNAYLADFGIAKNLNVGSITEEGALVGSPAYITPEQIKGEPITPRADIYSLGLVMYEMLANEKPFPDATTPLELIHKHLNTPLPLLTVRRPNLPAALNEVLQTATAKEPDQRYANILRFAAAFRAAAPSLQRLPPQPLPDPLTQRELDILRQMIDGSSNQEIAQALYLALETVRWYVKQIYSKLDVHGRQQAVERAQQLNLLAGPAPRDASQSSIELIRVEPIHAGRAESTSQLINPYKGLRAFQEVDAADFFGRAALTEQLLARLTQSGDGGRFLAVVGPSGSGKSSAVKAGLVSALHKGGLVHSERWFVTDMQPGTHPFEELEAALLRIAVNPLPGLLADLSEDRRGLVRVVKRLLPSDQDVELVLVIDQFEELFTLVDDEKVRTHFINNLLSAASDPRSRVRLILTLRADFYDRPLRYPRLAELVRSHTEVIVPLTQVEMERAIVGPAERIGLTLQPGLVNAILADVGDQPGTLPLLQYALTELFERRNGPTLTLDAYRASGGISGALARRADELYEDFEPEGQAVLRQLFLRLVALGEGTEDTRRRVVQTELSHLVTSERVMDDVLTQFGQYRLLTFDHDPLMRGPTVEIAHEALIHEWQRLRGWLEEDREDLQVQRRLMASAVEWIRSGKDASFLAAGARLAQFEVLAADANLALNETEQAYLRASIAERDARQQEASVRRERELTLARQAADSAQQAATAQRRSANRLRYLVAALMTFLIAATGLSVLALQGRSDALDSFKQAESQRLAAESANVLQRGDSPELAALLAIRGLQAQYSPQADAALQKASRPDYGVKVFKTPARVVSVAISPDGRYVVTGGDSGVQLWDLQSGVQLRTFDVKIFSVAGELAFSPDGKYLLTASSEGPAAMWDVQTGAKVRSFVGHTGDLFNVAFSPDGRYVLTSGRDKTARLWDATTGAQLRVFSGHTSWVGSVAFAPDGRTILTTSNDETVRLWDAQSGDPIWSVHIPVVGRGAAFSPDGHSVVVGSFDKTAHILDAATGKELQRLVGHTEGLFATRFSPDGRFIVTSSLDQTARLWDVATGKELHRFLGHTASVYDVAFSPDGRYIITGGKDNTARLWDVRASPELGTFSGSGQVRGLAISPDSKYLLVGRDDGTAHLWNIATGVQAQLLTYPAAVDQAIFSPDGKYILTSTFDGVAHLWDIASAKEVRTFQDRGQVTVAFSPDGHYILTSGEVSTTLWDAATGKAVRTIESFGAVAFSRDGGYFAIGSDNDKVVQLYEASSGKVALTILSPSNVIGVAFSPDGKAILTGTRDNVVRLWDVQTGQLLQSFVGHTNIVWAVAFSPDGRYVLTGSQDKTARLWDAATGTQLRTFPSHNFSAIMQVAYSPDGQAVAIGSSDGTTQLTNVKLDTLIQSVCSRLLRDFTDDERKIYSINDKQPTCSQSTTQPSVITPTWTPYLTPTIAP